MPGYCAQVREEADGIKDMTHIYIYIYTYTHIHIYIYTYTYRYTYRHIDLILLFVADKKYVHYTKQVPGHCAKVLEEAVRDGVRPQGRARIIIIIIMMSI